MIRKTTQKPDLVLASSSPYRRELLERFRIPFSCDPPEIDESHKPGESPQDLVLRLAKDKANKTAERHPAAVVIGSDQVAVLNNTILVKPVTHENGMSQLKQFSQQNVRFLTGLCVVNLSQNTIQSDVITSDVRFRKLNDEEIERYLSAEQPYHCAGGFKSEGLGITLTEEIRGKDPTALIGLPLIRLAEMLREEGINLP